VNAALAPWQQRALDRALDALRDGRLAHGLLLCGPPRLGKRAVAERLAQALVCEARRADGACGQCGSCRQFQSRYQRDPLETRPDETPAHPDGHPGHPDVRFVSFALNEKSSPKKMYQEIVIDQVRELSSWLTLTPSREAKVALVEPAHLLNVAAANALLKTLEEPIPGRYLLLVSEEPQRLPATIRSRCQRLEVRLPPLAEARAWLRARGVDQSRAETALAANLGHPGLAARDLEEGGLELRREVAADLVALAAARTTPGAVAARWQADRPAQRLAGATEALHEWLQAQAQSREAASGALARAGLKAGDPRRLAGWFDEALRARALLRTPLRQDLLLAELLRQWREAAAVGPASPKY
jgi:DNA polymerase-3 subunit delta'